MRKYLKWSQEESRRFYAEHSDKFFYQRVVQFMASGPMRAYILAHEDAITHWRQLMGPTRVFRARYSAPLSIRGELGLTDTRNTTHGSAAEAGHVCSTLALSATREPAADVNSPFLNLHSRSQAMEKDSPESAAREISFFFPDFQQQRWLSSEEKLYRQGHYYYHPEQQVHLLRDPQPLLVRGH
ncbi:nucleoside diphosphate kinase 6 isoform X3 [Narcine bancroftii]